MKRTILMGLVAGAVAISGCSKTERTPPAADPAPAKPAEAPKVERVKLDLGAAGLEGATIEAPVGASARRSFGDVEITGADKPLLQIHPHKTDLEAFRKAVEENTVNKLERFVVASPEALVYETRGSSGSEYHFIANVAVGDQTWSCEDVKGPVHTRDEIEAMLATCRTLARE